MAASSPGNRAASMPTAVKSHEPSKVNLLCTAIYVKKMRAWTKVVKTPFKPEPSCNGGGNLATSAPPIKMIPKER